MLSKDCDKSWHRVIAWENQDTADAFKLEKGSQVHVLGRLRIQRYTGADGVEREAVEVIASKVESI